jgi:hypothetical protein
MIARNKPGLRRLILPQKAVYLLISNRRKGEMPVQQIAAYFFEQLYKISATIFKL